MGESINVILVEDNDDDVIILQHELSRAGFDVHIRRVQTAGAFSEALAQAPWDAVISDYNLPNFDAPHALKILKNSGKDLPFIVVSGVIDEETAKEIMRAGAHDYFVKGSLSRLAEALRREIRDNHVRNERRAAEIALRESEKQLRLLFERSGDAIFILDRRRGQCLNGNQAAEILTGRSLSQLQQLSLQEITLPNDHARMESAEEGGAPGAMVKVAFMQPNGGIRITELTFLPINEARSFAIAHDVTERIETENALRNRAQELEALYHTSIRINAQVDLLSLLRTIVEQAASLLNASMGGLYLLRPKEAELELVVGYNLPEDMIGARLKPGEGLSGRVFESGEAMVISDYTTWPGQAGIYKGRIFRRVLATPLRIKGSVIGVIDISDNLRTGSFTPDEIRLASLFADQAAIAVENAHLVEDLQHELKERKQADESLRSTKAFLDHVLKAVPLGIGVFNIETRKMEFDNNLQMTFSGLTLDQFNEMSLEERWKYVHPDDRQRRTDFMLSLPTLQDGEVRMIDYRRQRSGDLWRWFRYRYFVFERDASGKIIRLLTVTEDVTDQKNAEQALQHQLGELSVLHEIARAGIQANTIDELISFVTEEVSRAFYPENFGMLILDDTAQYLIPHPSYRGIMVEHPALVPLSGCISGQAILTGKPQRLGNVSESQQYYEVTAGIQSELCVPIKAGEHILGVINAESRQLDFFTENDERLLVTIAGQMAIGIERIRLFDSERNRRQEAETLRQATAALSTSLDLDQVLERILQSLKQVVPYDSAAVFLLEGDHLRVRVAEGFEDTDRLLSQSFPSDDGLFQEMAATGKPLILADAQQDGRFRGWGSTTYTHGWMSTPLIWREKVIGFITLDSRKPAAYSPDSAALAQAFAHQSAAAIENARLFEGLENSLLDLNQAYESTIVGWSRAMDLRDKETEGHTLRVTKMTVQLAEAMGISGKDLVNIRYGSLLHDIGKLGVPDRILLKPDSLTADEWVIMRRHPRYAYEMLSGVDYLRPALDIPYYHHEQWDGNGYPSGLKGEEIPLAARLFAVVDVWDALTSDRPYRPAWSNKEAKTYIKACSGKQFDPFVVEKFLDVFRD